MGLKPANYKDAFMAIKTETPGHITLSEFRAFSSLAVSDTSVGDSQDEVIESNLESQEKEKEIDPLPSQAMEITAPESANDCWDRIYDEDSGAHYFQHKTTFET